MAIVPMQQLVICGLKKDRKAVLEALQRFGNFEVIEEKDGKCKFEKLNTEASASAFKSAAATGERAIEILDLYAKEKTSPMDSLNGRRVLLKDEYYKYAKNTESILKTANRLLLASKRIGEKKGEIVKCEYQRESLLPWLDLKVPMTFGGTKKTSAFIGNFPQDTAKERIIQEFARLSGNYEEDIFIDIPFVGEGSNFTAAMIVCLKAQEGQTEKILRDMGFSYPSFKTAEIPSEKYLSLAKQIEKAQEEIASLEEEIKSLAESRRSLEFLTDYYTMRCEKYKVLSQVGNLKKAFFIKGYTPKPQAEKLRITLEKKYNAAVEVFDAEDDVPVLLKNNNFASPVESVVESYSLPNRKEIDPSAIMAIFYYFMFGLMLGDFAYGMLMVLGCGFALLKFKNMEEGMKKTLKMFMYCGLSTAFWGLMFGSCFGDAVTVIGKTFFNADISFKPLWFEPIKDPIRMLMFSFGVGIVHLFAGLGIKFYLCIKSGNIKDAIYDVIFWYLLVGGGIVYLFSFDMFVDMSGLNIKAGPITASVAKWCALVGAAGIVLTNGRNSKNPVKRLVKGLYELYNVTGYLSDILSYSRLLALGLATGVIAQVFNKIGSMGGGGALGVIMFVAVFLIGHTVNLGINLLGAYVHTNRLQFVEFFGKFYEGGGRKYSPFSENTKYYKIKEDN